MARLSRTARRIRAGGPSPEINPLTKTFVSMTRRGGNVSCSTSDSWPAPGFPDRLHGLGDRVLHLRRGHSPVGRLHFIDRFPRIDVPKRPPDNQRLRQNPADGSTLVERLLRHFLVNAGRHSALNLTVECPGHGKTPLIYTTIPWYMPDGWPSSQRRRAIPLQ